MAWFGRVSLEGFPDIAGAVTKLSESVKNIEKNFDSALGLETSTSSSDPSSEASGIWPLAADRKALFDPVMAFVGQKGGDDAATEMSEKTESPRSSSVQESDMVVANEPTPMAPPVEAIVVEKEEESEAPQAIVVEKVEESEAPQVKEEIVRDVAEEHDKEGGSEIQLHVDAIETLEGSRDLEPSESQPEEPNQLHPESTDKIKNNVFIMNEGSVPVFDSQGSPDEKKPEVEVITENISERQADELDNKQDKSESGASDRSLYDAPKGDSEEVGSRQDLVMISEPVLSDTRSPNKAVGEESVVKDVESKNKELSLKPVTDASHPVDTVADHDKVKKEMKMMEAALQGAARQAQAKADEIARLMNENENLKSTIEDLKRKSSEVEIDALREEYHQRVASLEKKVYALTRERDALRREQNKKSDATALLKEKDEIINQVMAEGEELSKKQAAQEAQIRKLRAQIREFEEEKQRLNSKLQVEETKVESMKRDKAATEKLLQETIEKSQAELAAQKEIYTNALNAAKEAEALAEARANNEAKIELERRLKESGEREAMLVQTLEELRQTLSRTEQQAVFREEMLRRDIDDLQKRYQASELRCEELITQVPESTRPLLRQIEAMQETIARRAEAWAGVERSLNSRLQEAEAKAAAAEESERSMNDRLSQTLSRMAVLETQISCLRAEQTQLSRTLEKERQRASESRQEYLAAKEEAATQEGRARQLEDEIKELRSKQKQELQKEKEHRELLEKELERERTARLEQEKSAHLESSVHADQGLTTKQTSPYVANGSLPRLTSGESLSSMDQSFFLQTSLDSSDNVPLERRFSGEATANSYFLRSMTPSAFEVSLRQKDGELASYISRLASLESIRDSLAEELVKMTAQCEKLQAESSLLPGIRAELEALRRRHSSALELMGERDEQLEELRADIMDLKEMYREQVDLLVNKIQMLSSSTAAS
ncbi:Golgin candidate 5 [Acorus calamus]|uniref:Golgin candidate 5 n=1 Tax=Acorus calamus TaxID=4465 RepID=A0AAV9EPW3_ACOCL|nr:Golgin candidate 5 [Acorus calamus]